ncbi:MAG TPA: ATP-binding protein [Anaerolineales bacterium]|nr:ATP-binding protein [Anaerolineales bacterium]
MDDVLAQNLMTEMVYAVNYESLATNIVNFFANLFEAELCTLWRRIKIGDEDKLVLSAAKGSRRLPGAPMQTYTLRESGDHAEIEGVTAWIAIEREVCLANSYYELTADEKKPWIKAHRGLWDRRQFPEWDPQDRSFEAPKGFKNLLGLPIVYRSPREKEIGEVIGVLKIESAPNGFSKIDKQLAEGLMPFVAIALRTMEERENHEQSRQRALRDLTAALSRGDPNTFNQVVVEQTAEMLKAKICSLWLVDKRERKLKLGANFGVISKEKIPEYSINWDAENDRDIEGLTPWVLIRKRTFYGEQHQDLIEHPSWQGRWDKKQWAEMNFGCLYAVPLIDVNGDAFGVLKIENGFNQPKFDAVDRATFDLMADFIALALEFNSRLRADIIYDFFHLLKQPATNAIGALADLRRELKGERRESRIASRLDMLAKNLATLRVWILNVYGLATAQDETPGMPHEVVSIREILAVASENMKNLFDDFNCNLDDVQNISIKLSKLKRQKVDAILFNLLDNSYKYTDEKNKDIRAIARCEGRKLMLTIQDNGKGIPPEELSLIFNKGFTRGHKNEKWPTSLGLGLSTVARLMEELGWERKIESQVGEGTRFMITIPEEYFDENISR